MQGNIYYYQYVPPFLPPFPLLPLLTSRFLSLLENEIYSPSSPIWREDFNQTPEALAIPSPGGSSKTPTPSPAGSTGRMMGNRIRIIV